MFWLDDSGLFMVTSTSSSLTWHVWEGRIERFCRNGNTNHCMCTLRYQSINLRTCTAWYSSNWYKNKNFKQSKQEAIIELQSTTIGVHGKMMKTFYCPSQPEEAVDVASTVERKLSSLYVRCELLQFGGTCWLPVESIQNSLPKFNNKIMKR